MPDVDKYFEKFIPVDGPLPKQNGFQREHLFAAFKYVKKWRVAVDVGAHVGFWTRDMAERFETVHAFEAAPDTYKCLVENTKDLPNVKTYPFAVGSKGGQVMIMKDARREAVGNTGSRYVMPTEEGDVRMVSVDSLGLVHCDFMKVDVEGFEPDVIKGARGTLRRHMPVVIMECDKQFHDRYGFKLGQAADDIFKLGYQEAVHLRPDRVFIAQRKARPNRKG